MLRNFNILLLSLIFNDLKCIKLSSMFFKYLPASNILGVGTKFLLLFLCTTWDLYFDQSPFLKQCVQINQPKTFQY